MNYEEFEEVITKISNSYPYFLNVEDKTGKVKMWHEFLKEMDYRRVMYKVNQHILNNKYEPKIADVKPVVLTPIVDYEQKQKELFRETGVVEPNKPHEEKAKVIIENDKYMQQFIADKKAQFLESRKGL